ncbi:hypothetical protein GGGNBK_01715 [Sporosarcina sp. ANT_H38]
MLMLMLTNASEIGITIISLMKKLRLSPHRGYSTGE